MCNLEILERSEFIMKKFEEKLNKEHGKQLIQTAACFFTVASTVIPFYATDLANNLTTAGNNILQDIASVYKNSIYALLASIFFIMFFFCKDDKKVQFAKKGLAGTFIVYIICSIFTANTSNNIITNTADTIGGWIN